MNEKKRCEGCQRNLNKSKLSQNRVTGQMLCLRCNNKIGQNKFYKPINYHNKRISNFSINSDETQYLISKGINAKKLREGLSNMKKVSIEKRNKTLIEATQVIKTKDNLNKKFVEGLK